MFTQPISMDCTFEQYQKFLKEPLKEIGYKEWFIGEDTNSWRDIILTNHGDSNDRFTDLQREYCSNYNCTYLGSFNAPLFLALAAMTDKAEGNYGEYVIGLGSGRLYKMTEGDKILPEYKIVRKATKEELMEKFGENKTENGKEIAEKLCNDINRLQREVVNSYIGQTINQTKELEAISLLKSKGYKILKPKTWEEV